jgi:general secretion pathway protein F
LALLMTAGYVRRRWHQDAGYRVQVDQGLHRLPVFASFYSVLVNLRFTRTLSMLLQSGLPLLDALQQAGRASGSPWLEALIVKETEHVRHGTALSEAIARIPPLSGTLPGWIRAGEASGDLTGMLEHAAKRSQQTWERRITRSMTLVESGLVIVVGAIVFVLALAIVLPILSLNRL